MQIEDENAFRRFMDTIKVNLLMWRRGGEVSLEEISEKLGVSVRTVRRRCNSPEHMTLGEYFAWCELYGKDPAELLRQAANHSGSRDPILTPLQKRKPFPPEKPDTE